MQSAHIGFIVFLAGYYAFPNGWWHLMWFGLIVVLPMASLWQPSWVVCTRRAPFLIGSTVFILTMLSLSLRPGNPRPSLGEAFLTFADILFLLVFVRMAFRLGRRPHEVARKAILVMVQVAAATAAISLLVFYWLPGNEFPVSRLQNLFVYLGLSPVLTGLLYGFAGLAAAILAMGVWQPRMRGYLLGMEALLLFASLCSHTRGAVLALAAGFVMLVVTQFHRRLLLPLSVLVLVTLIYQFALPQMGHLSSQTANKPPNPTASMVARKDSGRLELYRLVLLRMTSPGDYLVGRGRWANDVVKPPEMHWHAHHPHSIYLATFYRGGFVGMALLGLVVFIGMSSCWQEARRGHPLWLALACYGLAAFLFDGDDLVTMASMPRIEPLLFWLPFAAGAGVHSRNQLSSA